MRSMGAVRWLSCRLQKDATLRVQSINFKVAVVAGRRAFSQTSRCASAAQEACVKFHHDETHRMVMLIM